MAEKDNKNLKNMKNIVDEIDSYHRTSKYYKSSKNDSF